MGNDEFMKPDSNLQVDSYIPSSKSDIFESPYISSNLSYSSQQSLDVKTNNYFHPEEIFQLDQPIKTEANINNYNYSTQHTGQSKSPSTVLDLESGSIHMNYVLRNEYYDPLKAEKYEMSDDNLSLMSGSSVSVNEENFYYLDSQNNNGYNNVNFSNEVSSANNYNFYLEDTTPNTYNSNYSTDSAFNKVLNSNNNYLSDNYVYGYSNDHHDNIDTFQETYYDGNFYSAQQINQQCVY
jgi:hypothetical protein